MYDFTYKKNTSDDAISITNDAIFFLFKLNMKIEFANAEILAVVKLLVPT